AEVGRVIYEQRFRIFHYGNVVADVPVDALVEDAPVYHLPATAPNMQIEAADIPQVGSLDKTLLKLLAEPMIASKEWVYGKFDTHVREEANAPAHTIVPPGSDAAVVGIRGTRKALAMTADCNSRYL